MSRPKMIDNQCFLGQTMAKIDTNTELGFIVRSWVESVTKYQNKKTSRIIEFLVRDMLSDPEQLAEYGFAIEAKHTTSGQIEIFKVGA